MCTYDALVPTKINPRFMIDYYYITRLIVFKIKRQDGRVQWL